MRQVLTELGDKATIKDCTLRFEKRFAGMCARQQLTTEFLAAEFRKAIQKQIAGKVKAK